MGRIRQSPPFATSRGRRLLHGIGPEQKIIIFEQHIKLIRNVNFSNILCLYIDKLSAWRRRTVMNLYFYGYKHHRIEMDCILG